MGLKVLILGISGLIGNQLYKNFLTDNNFDVYGTVRSDNYFRFFQENFRFRIFPFIDVLNTNQIQELINTFKPSLVINSIGITKHKIEHFSL